MKIEMTKLELTAYLSKSEDLLQTLYRYLLTDVAVIQEDDGFYPPLLSIDNVDDSCANVIDAADDLRRVAEATLAILETLDFIQAVLENHPANTPTCKKPENANV